MVTAGAKAMQENHGPALLWSQHPPVAVEALPMPSGTLTPVDTAEAPLPGSVESGCIQRRLSHHDSHYREGAVALDPGEGFFRPDSRPSRDLSVLLAAWVLQQRQGRECRWLDLMAGCGIRSLRWGVEALPAGMAGTSVALTVNDADEARLPLLMRNLHPLTSQPLSLRCLQQPAEVLLRRAYLDQQFFDLIDLDAFGCPNGLLQATLQALAFNGVLLLASTDGRSPTGHDRSAAVRRFGAAARVHPASWEVALRLQLAALAREAWLLGRGLQPLACFSDGRTFRLAVRLTKRAAPKQEQQLGFLARCDACGDQSVQTMLRLQGWRDCACGAGRGRWAVSGPLWLGALQQPDVIAELMSMAARLPQTLSSGGQRLLQRLAHDPGLPATCWSTAELARRLQLPGPPPIRDLITDLQAAGFHASASGVMAGQLRTDAPLDSLLQICRHQGHKDR